MPADAASTEVPAAPPLQAALVVAAMMAVQALATMAVLSLAAVAPEVGRALDLPPSLIGYQISVIYAGAKASSVFGGGLPQRWGAIATSQAALALCAAGALLAVLPSLAALALGSFVIGLCYGSETSMAEAGEILGLSAAATRTRLWRALGRLRKVLVR